MSLLKALKLPPPATMGAAPAVSAQKQKQLADAAASWRQTHAAASTQIAALKAAVKTHCADGHPALLAEIDKGLAKLDGVMGAIDHRLAESMASAGAADDHGEHRAELEGAKTLLMEYITYVTNEPLVAHVDDNPFGVKTGLKALLVTGLRDAAKAIG